MSLDKVTVFKINETITGFEDFIRTVDGKQRPLPGLQPLNLPEDLEFDGEIKVAAAFKPHIGKNKTQHDIPWLAFINEGRPVDDQFTFNSRNRFPCAVVAIRITVGGHNSFFAVTFGLGAEGFLKPSAVVRDFGIRVAMNICDREKLRRVQTSIHESVSTQSEKQISVGSSFSVFNIDDEKEFLRSISGAAKPGYEYIKSFTGKENIAIKNDKDNSVNWHNIIPRIQALNLAYGQDEYKEKFPGYDKFHFETDREKIARLDSIVFEHIRDGNLEKIHLAPPEFVDFESLDFSYHDSDDAPHFDDLVLSDLLDSKRRPFGARSSIKSLKNMRIFLWNIGTGVLANRWSAYKCLVAEVELDGAIYILTMEQWKRVSDDLQAEVDSYVAEIAAADDPFLLENVLIWNPDARHDRDGNPVGQNREEVYNQRVSDESDDVFLFDKARVEIAGERRYEVCDLFHREKAFIQVKRLQSGSASIIQVFLQGRFYGDAFLSDSACRTSMRSHIRENIGERDPDPFIQSIPEIRDDVIANEYRIIFCMLCDQAGVDVDSLPFMARYELMHTHQYLRGTLGYKCEVAFRSVQLGP